MKFHLPNLVCFFLGHDWKGITRQRLNRRTMTWYPIIDHFYCKRCSHDNTYIYENGLSTLPEICRSIIERLRSYIHKNDDNDIPF